ncbi:MAG: hypothetical protein KDE27_17205 [Planctomycetes bacterium]|nr:hypothetical protein [Planctomycetota bacterium]
MPTRYLRRLIAATAVLTAPLLAQIAPDRSEVHPLAIDSGFVANTNPAPAVRALPLAVWSTVVTVPNSTSLRLHYSGVLLAGSRTPGRDGSFLKITSLLDGAFQTQHLVHVGQWQETSAYFNGDSVLVEIWAQPGTGDNRLMIDRVSAEPDTGTDSLCNATDNRVLSNDPRVGRNFPMGCTSWLIDDCSHCLLTAGHCAGALSVIQFNVPSSTMAGAIVHPPPQDQYMFDPASVQRSIAAVAGDDWAYFGVYANSTTNLTPYEANGGQSYVLTPAPTSTTQSIRVTGFGTTSPPIPATWNQVQTTHAGPFDALAGTEVRYEVDTTSGNSGSPVVLDGTDQAIAIHTHGGCDTLGWNSGTDTNHQDLQNALANPKGVCRCPAIEFSYPNQLPSVVAPNGTTTIRVQIGGPQTLLAGSVRFHVSTGGAFQTLVPNPVGNDQFDVEVPAAVCLTSIQFWFSAQDTAMVTYTDPEQAPTSVYQAIAGDNAVAIRNYDFNTAPPGWSVINTSLSTGAWTRATPLDPQGPTADFDGSGQCWVTGNVANEDVDGGPTVLRTETFDLSTATDPRVRYALWFENTNVGDDVLLVEASDNGGGSWTTIETLSAFPGWQQHGFRVLDHFTNMSQIVVRFSVADSASNSLCEAAIDAFRIDDSTCLPASWTSLGGGCPGTNGIPVLTASVLPALGATFTLDVTNLAGGIALMVFGDNQQSVPLQPLGLGFGPGCTLLVTGEAILTLSQQGGSATWTLDVPNDPSFAGQQFYNQVAELEATTSSLSNAGEATIR